MSICYRRCGREGGCKFSPLSRDTRYLAKDYSSGLQACCAVDVRSIVTSVHPPFTCVVCHSLLVRQRAAIKSGRDCAWRLWRCWAVAAFPSIGEEGHRREDKNEHRQLLSLCPTPFQQLSHVQVTIFVSSRHWATADEVDLLTETQRYAIAWSKQGGDDAKLQYRFLLPFYKASLNNMMNLFFLADSKAARRLSLVDLSRWTVDQCLCNSFRCDSSLHAAPVAICFLLQKTLFHEFVLHFNRFSHRNSRVAASHWSLRPLPLSQSPTEERKENKHHQLLSPCPTPFHQLIHVQTTLRLQSPATADEVDWQWDRKRETGEVGMGLTTFTRDELGNERAGRPTLNRRHRVLTYLRLGDRRPRKGIHCPGHYS